MKLIFRPLLVSGMLGADAEGDVMLIDNEQRRDEMAKAIWHETVHLLLLASGKKQHDEEVVEAMALRLAAACPDIVELLKGGR